MMADKDKEKEKPEEKYTGAFEYDESVDKHRIVANSSVSAADVSPKDYDTWDWKQIKAEGEAVTAARGELRARDQPS